MSNSINIFLKCAGIAFVTLILIALFAKCIGQKPELHLPSTSIWVKEKTGRYEFANPTKLAGWGMSAVAGFIDGTVEGYEFDGRHSFERKWGKSKSGFWGSESWRLAYKDGNPESGFKNNYTRYMGAMDFYHIGDDLRKYGYIGGGVCIGIGGHKVNSKWWHYALDYAIGFAISGIAKSEGMKWVRN